MPRKGRESDTTWCSGDSCVNDSFLRNFGILFVFHHVLSTQISKHIKTPNIVKSIFTHDTSNRGLGQWIVGLDPWDVDELRIFNVTNENP